MIGSFGTDGIVDLKVGVVKGVNEQIDLETGEIGVHTAPTVVGDARDRRLLDARGRHRADPQQHQGPGARLRCAHAASSCGASTPSRGPGEPGNETWENNSWADNGNTGVWTHISADRGTRPRLSAGRNAVLGLLRRPSARQQSLWREHRRGRPEDRRRSAGTYQFVHHPIWNFDMPSAPILADINVNGRADQGGHRADQAGLALCASTASPGSRCGRSRRSRCRSRTCRAKRPAATQPFPPDKLRYARNVLQGAGRSHRLHAGAARAGARCAQALQGRAIAVRAGRARPTPTAFSAPSSPARRPTGRAAPMIPETAHRLHAGRQHAGRARAGRAARRFLRHPLRVQGVAGQPFREVLGPGDCCAAGAPQTAERARLARDPASPTRRRPPAASAASNVAGAADRRSRPTASSPRSISTRAR